MRNYLNNLGKKEKLAVAVLVGWSFIHLIFLLISDGNKRVFWPFDDQPILDADYDITEFLVYVITPILVFATYLFLMKSGETKEVKSNFEIKFNLRKLYNENRKFSVFLLLWFLINLTCLLISNCTWEKFPCYPQLFYPFSGYPHYLYSYEKNPYTLLIYTYSYTEFIVYVSVPLIIFYFRKKK